MTVTNGLAAALADGEVAYSHPRFPQYVVTSHGRVYSFLSGRFLKPGRMGCYLGLMIVDADGKIAHVYVHRLVLEAAVGPCPQGMEARHLNGDREDNRASNLAWGTPQQNAEDKRRHGTVLYGSRNPMAKLTWDQVREIRAMVQAGATQRQAVARYGVSPMTVSRIVRGQTWTGDAA